jgi:RecA/RadA recombinase
MVKKTDEVKQKINVEELVALAQGRFAKKNAGLAARMKTGDKITLSTNPEDYICSPEIDAFWKPMTGLLGVPYGRIVQIAGKPDSGKSTAAMLVMKAAQQNDTLVILWDAEGKFDSARFKERMGGDPSQILVATSRNILEGIQQVAAYVKAVKEILPNQKILIVWDSVGASINSAEDEENEDISKQPGVTAKEVTFSIKRLNQLIEKYRDEDGGYSIAVLCINQLYAKIGFMAKGDAMKGGAELEYLSSLILGFTRKGMLTRTKGGNKVKWGIETRIKSLKNHLFGGDECLAELDLIVTASGIEPAKEAKKKNPDIEEDEDE